MTFERLPLLGAVVSILQSAKHVVVTGFVVLFFSAPGWVLAASLAAFAFSTTYYVVRWLTQRISVDGAELRTTHTFIGRTDRRIPIASIHDLHFEQSLLQRALGVVTVRIDTAGGSGSEADLSGLLRPQAEALKAAIEAARLGAAAPTGETGAEPAESVLVDLGVRDLALAGLTSATIWIVGGALASAWFFLDDLIPGLEQHLQPLVERAAGFVQAADVATLIASAIVLGLALIVCAAVISVARTIVRFWRFRVTWNGMRLLRSCGLLTTRRQVLRVARVQRVVLHQSLLQRCAGCVSMTLDTAAIGRHDKDDEARTFRIPILTPAGARAVLDTVAPEAAGIEDAFDRVSPLAGRRYLIRAALFLAVVSAALAFWRLWAAAAVWIVYVRDLVRAPRIPKVGGTRLTPALVQFRTGALGRRVVTLPRARVQGAELSQTPFDRRLGLASLEVWVAGANAGDISDVPEDRAREMLAALVLEKPKAGAPDTSVGSEFDPSPALS